MSETKITSASVRVSLSFAYNTFEVALSLENQDGISLDEINQFRLEAHELAEQAVDDYKLKNTIENQVKPFGKKDNTNLSDIEKLPLHPAAKVKYANHKEFERLTYLINDCLTIKELMKLKKDVPEELNDIFNNKFIELGDGK